MRRFLPGATSCSSCSGDRAPKNLSIRSAVDFQTRRAESIIRVSKDSLACIAQSFLSCYYQRSPQPAVPPLATGGANHGERRAAGTCAPRRRVPLEKSNVKPPASLAVVEHLNDAGIFVELVWIGRAKTERTSAVPRGLSLNGRRLAREVGPGGI